MLKWNYWTNLAEKYRCNIQINPIYLYGALHDHKQVDKHYKTTTERLKQKVYKSNKWHSKIVTRIEAKEKTIKMHQQKIRKFPKRDQQQSHAVSKTWL